MSIKVPTAKLDAAHICSQSQGVSADAEACIPHIVGQLDTTLAALGSIHSFTFFCYSAPKYFAGFHRTPSKLNHVKNSDIN
eukprot:3438022-Amphidinium_carterae.1